MGSGASSSATSRADVDRELLEAISKLTKLKPSKLLTGEQVENTIGTQLFDCNAFDIYAVPDNSKRGFGVHKVSREELLKVLQVHQVLNNADAKVPLPSGPSRDELSQVAENNLALTAPRSPSDSIGLRGAVAPLHEPHNVYTPLPPPDADATTVIYPYAAAMVLIFQKRPLPDAGWNLALWRSGATGEWTTITANFAARHAVSAAKPHQLRSAAAEALLEQSSGLLRVAPGHLPTVLSDTCAASVVWDGGPALDSAARPRPLVQLFAVHVDGVRPDDFRANREALSHNLAGAVPKGNWLDFDELAFTRLEDVPGFLSRRAPRGTATAGALVKAGGGGGTSRSATVGSFAPHAVTDTTGRVCPCRQLLELLARPRVASALTRPLPGTPSSSSSSASQPSVLAELAAKLDAGESHHRGNNNNNSMVVSSTSSAEPAVGQQSYHAGRWFAPNSNNALTLAVPGDESSSMNATAVISRVPETDGLLAGCDTALLTSLSNTAQRSSVW